MRSGRGAVDLTGPELAQYIVRAGKRLDVVRCLSRQTDPAVEASAGQFNNFATAGGRDQVAVVAKNPPTDLPQGQAPQSAQPPREVRVQLHSVVANPPKPPHDVAIIASCVDNDARIKVVNLGAAFPAPGNITVFRLDADRQVVKTRRMLLAAKQVSSFKVTGQPGVRQRYGVFVDPSWYFRGQTFDAELTCG